MQRRIIRGADSIQPSLSDLTRLDAILFPGLFACPTKVSEPGPWLLQWQAKARMYFRLPQPLQESAGGGGSFTSRHEPKTRHRSSTEPLHGMIVGTMQQFKLQVL